MLQSICDFIIKRIDLFFKRKLNDKDTLIEKLRELNLNWMMDEIEHGYTTGPLPLSNGHVIEFHIWFVPGINEVILKYDMTDPSEREHSFPETEVINVSSWRARRFYLELKLEAKSKQEWLIKERVSTFNKLIDSIK